MNINDPWQMDLKLRREEYEITQETLASAVGISREYLNKIENGKNIPSDPLKKLIEKALALNNAYGCMSILIDYVKVRFQTQGFQGIIENILKMKPKYFRRDGYGPFGYNEKYRSMDIYVMVSDDPLKGIIIELKGKGCRNYESALETQGRSWYDFLADCLWAGGVFKRLDIAIDDHIGLLDIPQLIDKCKNGECRTRFDKMYEDTSGIGLRGDSIERPFQMGRTLYLGSRKSELHFCIYEKAFEQYVKNGIPMEEAIAQNRFEIRLKNDRALRAVESLITDFDIEDTAFSIINRYVTFLDRDDTKDDPDDWEENREWRWFIGEWRGKLQLTMKPEPYTWDKSIRWLKNQCACTLAMVSEVDKQNGTNVLDEILSDGKYKLSEKHWKIIQEMTSPIEEVIIT